MERLGKVVIYHFASESQHMPRSLRIPSYRLHKPSGLAVVRLDGVDHYLGAHGTPASRELYERLVAEWLLNRKQRLPAPQPVVPGEKQYTVNELFLAYWEFAKIYYRKNDLPTGEQQNIVHACRPLIALYGSTPAAEFGPLRLKAVRQEMIRLNLCRRVVNSRVNRVRRLFKWGVENELVPATILHGLQAVAALKRGRSEARETPGVKPAPDAYVDAVLEVVSTPVRAMIELQRLTGMRSGEVTIMRGCDLDTTGKIWVYRPSAHKTEHHAHERVIFLGPRAQEIVQPFLRPDMEAFLFSPADAEAERRSLLRSRRRTPLSCGNRPGTNRKRKPRKGPGQRYTPNIYARAIKYACMRVYPLPEHLRPQRGESKARWKQRLSVEQWDEVKAWRRAHSWHPHQLRHNAATRLRKEFGIEAARVVLGHRSAAVTEIYAEVDQIRAADVMSRVG